MISRYRNQVPTKKEAQDFQRELKLLKPLTKSPVRVTAMAPAATFGEPVDLGIFPQLTVLKQREA
ncbi:hypothetical protein [Lacticaseibacillus absianus]|uniref:hypothetical protein n=1 Tax=Lacticaseibacillus absianus TaxID=2729623 RepID=UPI0015C7051C|nr:hypothetical protein [Lacticaseibacillus absianus]